MISIVVQRGEGDLPGEDIVEPLLTSIPAALSRGRAELDAGEDAGRVSIECRYQVTARPGQLIRIVDARQGESWLGQIVAVTHDPIPGGAVTRLEIRRPL